MIRLILFRHAKAVDAEPGMADFDRPLAPRGRKDAEAMGEALAKGGYVPALILCSPALRTRQTLAGAFPALVEGMPEDGALRFMPGIYGGGDYLAMAQKAGGRAGTVMMIGHNPSVHQAARALAGSGEAGALAELKSKFPTAAVAVIDFDVAEWSMVRPGAGRLAAFLTPR